MLEAERLWYGISTVKEDQKPQAPMAALLYEAAAVYVPVRHTHLPGSIPCKQTVLGLK